jgi:hypothetical protein
MALYKVMHAFRKKYRHSEPLIDRQEEKADLLADSHSTVDGGKITLVNY